MTTPFQIGYPITPDSKYYKEGCVILVPNNTKGFRYVYKSGKKYETLEVESQEVLDGDINGVYGIFIENGNDSRKSIIQEQTHSLQLEGTSCRLALILGALAKYDGLDREKLPLLLFSASINLVSKAYFQEAEITSWSTNKTKKFKESLLIKYNAALWAKAYAIIFVQEDVNLLEQILQNKDIHYKRGSLKELKSTINYEVPLIIGIDKNDFEEVTKILNISFNRNLHFTFQTAKKLTKKINNLSVIMFSFSLLAILIFLFFIPESYPEFNDFDLYVSNNLYSEPHTRINPNIPVLSNTKYRIILRIAEDNLYVYGIQFDGLNWYELYPSTGTGTEKEKWFYQLKNPIQKGNHVLPPQNKPPFSFDSNKGTEKFVFLLSPKSLSADELKAFFSQIEKFGRGSSNDISSEVKILYKVFLHQ